MKRGLLDWVLEPSCQRGLALAQDDGGWAKVSYASLAEQVMRIGAGVVEHRARPQGPVALVLPSGADLAPAFFGALWAGHTPCPIAPPTFLRDSQEYVEHLAGILAVANPSLIVTDPTLIGLVEQAQRRAALPAPAQIIDTATLREHDAMPTPARAAELGLLQFTSGSHGAPCGVEVSRANLEENISMIHQWMRASTDDIGAAWLPLHHDMGLIGCLITLVVNDMELQMMRPEQFIREPLRWLECFGKGGATLNAAPSFAFGYCCKRIAPEQLQGLDFSAWRVAIVGAERVDAAALTEFAELLRPHGFQSTTFLAAYGLAEATLAVSGTNLTDAPRLACVQNSDADDPARVQICARASLSSAPLPPADGSWLVGCGRPLDELNVKIVDDDGNALPEGHIGEVVVRGPTVARGYHRNSQARSTRFADGDLRTGDAGFFDGDELFVLGRMGDSIKLRGRSVYMEDLEARAGQIPGVPRGKVVAFAAADATGATVGVLVEQAPGDWIENLRRLLISQLGEHVVINVLSGERGSILRTTSGKPRRRAMWQAWRQGEIDALQVGLSVNAPTRV
jgi:fatty-acyl-CoA synthase